MKKRVDPIKSVNTMLKESMGLQIVEGVPPGEKPLQTGKHFLIRTHKYPIEMRILISMAKELVCDITPSKENEID